MPISFETNNRPSPTVDRRTFLVAGGVGFCGLQLPGVASAAQSPAPEGPGKAKSTILIFLCGGASHIDTWDLKPDAPAEYRGEFKPIETSAPGVRLCEHLPRLARQAHHLAIVNSLGHFRRGTGDHHAGYYYNLTGHAPDPSFRQLLNSRTPRKSDWPFIGSVVGYKSPLHPYLPQTITLPQVPGAPQFTRPGQFSARLGIEHDPLYVHGKLDDPLNFSVPALSLSGDVSVSRLQSRRAMLDALNQAERRFDAAAGLATFGRHQEKAFSLLASARTKDAFDLSQEPEALREEYGATLNGMSMLMARRLVEAGVPFVTIFWNEDPNLKSKCRSAGGWDTHGNNFNCLKENLLPEFDQGFAALIGDLADRGLLDETLLMVTSEMGRKPKIGDPRSGGQSGAGRDHWTHAMSVLFAGGGIQGGQTYGSTDRYAEFPADLPVAPEDIAKTVYAAMGITDLSATDETGRPIQLMDEGEPITALF